MTGWELTLEVGLGGMVETLSGCTGALTPRNVEEDGMLSHADLLVIADALVAGVVSKSDD
ncbi:hypothetical protein PF003_g31443 [Phytophthora fragariae]|nr:hypothetical protein PF003_g31443 [Phytophthora fragariae]